MLFTVRAMGIHTCMHIICVKNSYPVTITLSLYVHGMEALRNTL